MPALIDMHLCENNGNSQPERFTNIEMAILDSVCNILLQLIDIDLDDDSDGDDDSSDNNNVDENANNDFYLSINLQFKTPPLRQTMRQRLAHLASYKRVTRNDPLLQDCCPICQDQYKPMEYKRELSKCKHTFHKRCVDNYFCKYNSNMECPMCRVSYAQN